MTNKIETQPALTVESARRLVVLALESVVEQHPAIVEVSPEIVVVPIHQLIDVDESQFVIAA